METDAVTLPLAPSLGGVEFAITIQAPWASITVEGPRRLHNLAARPPLAILGKKVAVYAAAKPDTTTGGQAMELLEAAGIGPTKRSAWTTRKVLGAIIGHAVVTGVVTEHDDPWFVGPFALVLDQRTALASPIKMPADAFKLPGGIWRIQ